MKRYGVGILGASGLVGQSLVILLKDHPWFEIRAVMASHRSRGKKYADAVGTNWQLGQPIPEAVKDFPMRGTDENEIRQLKEEVDLVFSAVSMEEGELIRLEEMIAGAGIPVISNNSALRCRSDVPLVIPEVNPRHTNLIAAQRKRLKTNSGFVVTLPNCSLPSYLPALTPLMDFGIEEVAVTTFQAVSGAGRHLPDWPEMQDNMIPFIEGEEEKSEKEPLKIWGTLRGNRIEPATRPLISAQCVRVPVEIGHLAAVFVRFREKIDAGTILKGWRDFKSEVELMGLPSAPSPFLLYLGEEDRPQPKLDVSSGAGMAISIGRLRRDPFFDYKFFCLSNNLIRGAAGGAILTAELLIRQGWIE